MAKKLTSAKAKEILHDKSVHGHPLTDKQRRFFGAIAGGAKPYKAEEGGWLDKYEQGGLVLKQKTHDNFGKKANANNSDVSLPPGFKGLAYNLKGRNYSPAWGGQFQDGGRLSFDEWYKTIPKDKNDTTTYNLRRAYELAPQKELDAFVNSNSHLHSAYENPQTGVWEFMKSKEHPTIQKELDWFNSNSRSARKFRNNYTLDTSGDYYRYIPKHQTGGILQPAMAGAVQTVPMAQLGDSVKPIPMQLAMGGSLPGAVGFTYARVAGSAPANGKYTKKTKASAQNGQEMKFYQEGLDFKPKTISQDGVAIDPMGYWNPDNVGNPVIIPSTDITMQGVDQPLIGISDTGDVQYMQPGEDYSFDGEYVTEYPVAQKGKKIQAIDVKDMKAKRPYPQYPVDDPRSVGLFFNRYKKPESEQEVVKKSEPVVEKKAPLTDYFQGTSVFAPTPYHGSGAGAFVGYRTPQGDTVFVKPEDYERMGVPKYGREFIESKKKMKNGGVSVNMADQYPIEKLDQSLNFTNYNKPTKGGWLDKYN